MMKTSNNLNNDYSGFFPPESTKMKSFRQDSSKCSANHDFYLETGMSHSSLSFFFRPLALLFPCIFFLAACGPSDEGSGLLLSVSMPLESNIRYISVRIFDDKDIKCTRLEDEAEIFIEASSCNGVSEQVDSVCSLSGISLFDVTRFEEESLTIFVSEGSRNVLAAAYDLNENMLFKDCAGPLEVREHSTAKAEILFE